MKEGFSEPSTKQTSLCLSHRSTSCRRSAVSFCGGGVGEERPSLTRGPGVPGERPRTPLPCYTVGLCFQDRSQNLSLLRGVFTEPQGQAAGALGVHTETRFNSSVAWLDVTDTRIGGREEDRGFDVCLRVNQHTHTHSNS